MTPAQLSEALRVRRRREERALTALKQAQAKQAEAEAQLANARGALAAFDAKLAAAMTTFEQRARGGVNPQSVMGMRSFYTDQIKLRESFNPPIAMAEGAVAMACDAVEQARYTWRQASQAAENMQEMGVTMARDAARHLERRQEQDRDELAATRMARLANQGGE